MAHYTHGWLGTLAGMLDMEEEHCRENLQHYASGPDHDTYAAFLADVLELRKRLRLYDAADSMLTALKRVRATLAALDTGWRDMDATAVDQLIASDGLNEVTAVISRAEGRTT